ncbi:MAG TPA: trypsin-like peptidase domain-containing protein [Candidatus Acidoferrum sp.]|nr:trypsin-like peptidase domain-containing protein [Candidatus Acidoferrum sp.]
MNATRDLRVPICGWLLAAALNCTPLLGADPLSAPPVPKPAPAHRSEWAAALRKPVPESIADLAAIEQHVKALLPRVSPAVVAVEVGYGSGSGVVVSSNGLVLTAGHVAGRAGRSVHFTFPDGKVAHGKTLGLDADTDSGLMLITDPGPWPCVPMGDFEDVRLGDWVLALGHPGGFDLQRSLVARLGRVIGFPEGAIQTDCTISPGDSGGPLVDMAGHVIGIHTAISGPTSENYHVAINDYYEAWDHLTHGPQTTDLVANPRAYIGASGVDDPAGCRITEVESNSPAARAGLKAGDIVLEVEQRRIPVAAVFRRWIAEAQPGETLHLEVKRGDDHLKLEVQVETPPGPR